MPKKLSPSEIESALAAIQSGERYFRHWLGMQYTEGVRYMAELCGAFWLIDAIASHQPNPNIRQFGEYQVWTLKFLGPNSGNAWLLSCDDGNGKCLITQVIPFSDFPLPEIKISVEDGVMLMPREH